MKEEKRDDGGIRDSFEANDAIRQEGGEEGHELVEHGGGVVKEDEDELFDSAVVESEDSGGLQRNAIAVHADTTQLASWSEEVGLDNPSSIVVSVSGQRIKAREAILKGEMERTKIPKEGGEKEAWTIPENRKNLVLEVSVSLRCQYFIQLCCQELHIRCCDPNLCTSRLLLIVA